MKIVIEGDADNGFYGSVFDGDKEIYKNKGHNVACLAGCLFRNSGVLTIRERYILTLHESGIPLESIAEDMELGKTRIRQILQQCNKKLNILKTNHQ